MISQDLGHSTNEEFQSAAESYADPAGFDPVDADRARLIDLWPNLPQAVRQAVCALAELGTPETASDERARLGSEVAALIQSLEL